MSVLYLTACPNWQEAGRRVRHAFDQMDHAATAVTFIPVEIDAEATALDVRGSPTITVDGEDLFLHGQPSDRLSRRLYPQPAARPGYPT